MLLPVWFASLETPGVSGTWELGALPPGPGQPACSWAGMWRCPSGDRRAPASGHSLGLSSLPSTQLPTFRQHRGWGRADSARVPPAPEFSAHGLGLVNSRRERGSLGVGRAVRKDLSSPRPSASGIAPGSPPRAGRGARAGLVLPPRGASPAELLCWAGAGAGTGLCRRAWPGDSEGGGSAPSSEGPGVPQAALVSPGQCPRLSGQCRPNPIQAGCRWHPTPPSRCSRWRPGSGAPPPPPAGSPAPQLGPPGGAEAKDRPRLFSPACLRLDRPLGGAWSLLPCPPGAGLCP